MRLLEFQAKRIFKEFGIPVPYGKLINRIEELEHLSYPVVLKAQVPVGGRGKAGAIRIVSDPAQATAIAEELFLSQVKGYPVGAIYVEEVIHAVRELYLAFLIDKRLNRPVLMGSADGGVDIEHVAKTSPERISKTHVDPVLGLQDFAIRSMAKGIQVKADAAFRRLISGMYEIFKKRDATLVEINPLAVTSNGLMALDGKILLDDKASFRHPELHEEIKSESRKLDKRKKTRSEILAEERQITYVRMDGDIGMIADGAGTGMLTMDLIRETGGRPANFCEMGGLANTEVMENTMGVILAENRIKVLLVSLIGGLTRMDEIAAGVVRYLENNEQTIPIVIRMCGTKAEVGKRILDDAGIEVHEDLGTAVQSAVAYVGER